jgi:hypothetical protein
MTGTLTGPAPLTAADRCDRCGAAAAVRVILATGGELLFCRHHANETPPASPSLPQCSRSSGRERIESLTDPELPRTHQRFDSHPVARPPARRGGNGS